DSSTRSWILARNVSTNRRSACTSSRSARSTAGFGLEGRGGSTCAPGAPPFGARGPRSMTRIAVRNACNNTASSWRARESLPSPLGSGVPGILLPRPRRAVRLRALFHAARAEPRAAAGHPDDLAKPARLPAVECALLRAVVRARAAHFAEQRLRSRTLC